MFCPPGDGVRVLLPTAQSFALLVGIGQVVISWSLAHNTLHNANKHQSTRFISLSVHQP